MIALICSLHLSINVHLQRIQIAWQDRPYHWRQCWYRSGTHFPRRPLYLKRKRLIIYASTFRPPPYCLQRYGNHQRQVFTITLSARSFDAEKINILIASYIVQAGANLILLARRADQLQNVADAASAAHKSAGVQQGGQIAVVQLDVTDRAQVSELWSKVPLDLRNVDILGELPYFQFPLRALTDMKFYFSCRGGWALFFRIFAAVNNAGGAHGTDLVGDIQDEDIDTMFATNVLGLISLTQLLVKGLPGSLHLTVHPSPQNTHLYCPSAA